MPFVIATTLRIVHADARTGVQTVRAYVQAYRGLRRDPDPQSPYTGEIVVTSMAQTADTARVFADRAEAARVCDNLVGPGASGAHVVKI